MSIYRHEAANQQGSDTATTIASLGTRQPGVTGRFDNLRLQLARELHDRAGWHLSALNYGIFAVETAPDDREALAELRRRFDALAATLREITSDVRRGEKVRKDIVGELSDLCSDWTRMTKIPVVLQSRSARMRLPHRISATFVSLVREALTNVSKHAANSSRVEITLSGGEGEDIAVTVSDDGPGIDAWHLCDPDMADHHGFAGMQERLDRIGGQLCIRPGQIKGTMLVFVLPGGRAR